MLLSYAYVYLIPSGRSFITIAIHIKKKIILVIKTKTLTPRERFGIGGRKLHCTWLCALAKRTCKSTEVTAELAHGLAKGGQTDSQVGSQVQKAVNFTHIIG